jgi:CubicO group peptidase (beta-lactamase class C family)
VADTRTEARLQDADLFSDLLVRLAGKHRVPGAQLAVRHHGETVAVEAGEQAVGGGRHVTGETAFPTGSVSKAFTATLAMILVADDDLDLDAPVGEVLPEVDELGDEFTLRRILSHTSGLTADPRSGDAEYGSLRRYVLDHCRPANLMQPPGAAFSYSNLGYVLTGRLVEVITGMSWWDAMESVLLRPLGIDPVFVGARLPHRRRVAAGHSVNKVTGRTRPVRQSVDEAEAPAGALAMSATDLVRLGSMHLGGGLPGLLPADQAAWMREPVTGAEPFGLADGWGLGLATFRSGETTWVGHDGNGDGTSCHFRIDPAGDWAIALTSNANTGYGMWQELLGELGAAGIPIEPYQPVTSGRAIRAPLACAGTYGNGDVQYEVSIRPDGRLDLAADGDSLGQASCHDDLTFVLRDPATPDQTFAGRFWQDGSTGLVDGVQLAGRLARRCARARQADRQRLTA